jgi:hypothetical protein
MIVHGRCERCDLDASVSLRCFVESWLSFGFGGLRWGVEAYAQ